MENRLPNICEPTKGQQWTKNSPVILIEYYIQPSFLQSLSILAVEVKGI